jgi:transposase InsO family protein
MTLLSKLDCGGEFTTTHFRDYCVGLGVRRELTAPCTPQQNGVVERRNSDSNVSNKMHVEGFLVCLGRGRL